MSARTAAAATWPSRRTPAPGRRSAAKRTSAAGRAASILAAASSTGGIKKKLSGRPSDIADIGSSVYANNKTCAISCTGHGEPFIRAVTAYDVSCLMEYKGLSLEEAMNIVVHDKLMKIEGEGGMIGVDAKGNGAMVFNSEGMYRGIQSSDGQVAIEIYK